MFLNFALRVQISIVAAVSSHNLILAKTTNEQKGQMSPPTDLNQGAPKAQTQINTKNGNSNNQKQKKKKQNKNHQKPTIILPHLHKDILASLNGAISPEPVYIRPGSQDDKVVQTRETNIVAFFTCPKASCAKDAWSSRMVAIVIRRFDLPTGMGYNATVYNQRCKACKELGAMNIDKEIYIERVVYRLKKWAGVPVERRHFDANKETPPHRKDLCEGGKRGVCVACGQVGNVNGRSLGPRRGGSPMY